MHSSILLLAAANLVSAHFQLEYPSWRADSLDSEVYSQYTYPCAGVPSGLKTNNRTDWAIDGGSLQLSLHHPWTYIFVNLGLGDNVTNFNYTLTPQFLNETGKGVLCLPQLPLPADLNVTDGQPGTIQVVTLGESGSALYNCADITFRSNVTAPFGGANCTTDATVTYSAINEQVNGTTVGSGSSSSSGSASSSSPSASSTGGTTSAGAVNGGGMGALASVAAVAAAFVVGMSM